MPLYEYKCTKCGSVFEVLQKFSDPPLKKCIHCQGSVKKLLSPPALQFKGNGWYVTDYAAKNNEASKPNREETKKEEKEASPHKKSSSSSSEPEKK
jgi:putative FmdB family regulatory protein